MERLSNSKRFMATYAAGGIGCTILSYFCTPSNSVGASGAMLSTCSLSRQLFLRSYIFFHKALPSQGLYDAASQA